MPTMPTESMYVITRTELRKQSQTLAAGSVCVQSGSMEW